LETKSTEKKRLYWFFLLAANGFDPWCLGF
jgi:hypothetical protein